MLKRLAEHKFNYFLDGYSNYSQIPIASRIREKLHSHVHLTHLLIHACLRAMQYAIQVLNMYCHYLFDMVEHILEVFMDDFFIFGELSMECLHNLDLILACRNENLILN